jgi:hypothetical protein
MRMFINRLVRQLSGRGALDNVEQVLEARASVAAQLDAFTARVTPEPTAQPAAA